MYLRRYVNNVALCFLALSPLLARTHASAAERGGEPEFYTDLTLDGAVWWSGAEGSPLKLHLKFAGDRAGATAWGEANGRHDQYGRVLESAVDVRQVRLVVRMLLKGRYSSHDATSSMEEPGRAAEYAIALDRNGNTLSGSWKGKSGAEERQGSAGGTIAPLPPLAPGFVAPRLGEHPRLLLRTSAIPALQEKAKTAWGAKLLPRLQADYPCKSNMAAGRGLLYVLTGDKRHADEARRLIEADIVETREWWPVGPVHDSAHTALEACIAYDLIHDACDPAFHAKMHALFAERVEALYWCSRVMRFNGSDISNWVAMYRSGSGLVALNMLADPVPYPPEPEKPGLPRLKPPADLAIGKDVPVVKPESGKEWLDWLYAGPFKLARGQDALEAIGGAAKARPENGTRLAGQGLAGPFSGAFQPAPKLLVTGQTHQAAPWSYGSFMLGGVHGKSLCGSVPFTTVYFYCVIDNERPGFYRVDLVEYQLDNPCIFIAGQRLRRGDYVHLDKGRYPVLAWIPTLKFVPTNSHDRQNMCFRLRLQAKTDAEAEAWLAKRTAWYEAELAEWKDGRARHAQSGGVHPRAEFWAEASRRRVDAFPLRAFGERGWTCEGEAYTQHSYRQVLPFVHCCRNALGRTLGSAGHERLQAALGLYAARTIFRDDGASMEGFANGGGTLGVDNHARGFGILDERLKPVMLGAWNRTQALADAGKLRTAWLEEDVLDPLSAAFMFVNYPLEMKERSAGEIFPLVSVDKDFGAYVFRDRWRDGDDFVATAFLQNRWTRESFPGCLRIAGLGSDWVVRGGSSLDHLNANRVFIPGKAAKAVEGVIKPTFFAAGADGSGVLSMDMDGLYPGAKVRRSFAVDYSGASGAPGLFAVADRVEGAGGKAVWQLVTDQSIPVEVSGKGFTLKGAGGATLQATVVSPAAARIETAGVIQGHEANYHDIHRGARFQRTVVKVSGGDLFLVVMTVQRGQAPAVTSEGGSVRVGRQTVRLDGEKIVLGRFQPQSL